MSNVVVDEIKRSMESINQELVKSFIESINNHNRIFVHATGRSGLMLKAFAMRLMQLGYTSYVVGETTTPSIKKGDLLIVASASGETDSVVSMAKKCKEDEIDVVSITGSINSSLSNFVKPTFIIESSNKFQQSEKSVQPMGSLFEQIVLILLDSVIMDMVNNKDDIIGNMRKMHASLE